MSRFKKYFYLALLAIMAPRILSAQNENENSGGDSFGNTGGDSSGNSGGDSFGNTFNIEIPNPLKGIGSLQEFVKAILDNIVLPIGSVVVVMAIIYAGFKFVTAQGRPEKLTEAKDAFLWVLIGAAILLGSWLIANAIKGTVDQLLVLG